MSYQRDQLQYCTFKVGDNVVLSRAWKQGERGFTRLWNITHARWIGRKLQVIGVQPDGVSVQYVNGRESFLVPWFVLERFEEKPQVTQAAESIPAGYEPVKIVQSQPMREFAGFWVDGAVRQPEQKHWRCDKCIFAIQKHDGSLDICLSNFKLWETVYWLDTTTPTELTPQQAFEISKILNPNLSGIHRVGETDYYLHQQPWPTGIVNWGDTDEYPPRQKWRAPTDADKGSLCRVKHDANSEWYESRFLVTDNGKFLARRDEDSYAYPYDFCEVPD